MSKWKRHKEKWSNCRLCELCETRKNVVLLKGKIPCDILFIGEAPGTSEDTLGKPFIGPAGKLLDQMIDESLSSLFAFPKGIRLAFTNLIACIPLDENGEKVRQPHKEHIMACSDRLNEIYKITRPSAVVMVGKLAESYVPKVITNLTENGVGIVHPAAILRADISQRGLAIQQTIVRLRDLAETLVPF